MAHIKRPPNAYMLFLAECRANAVIKLLAKTQMELCRLVSNNTLLLYFITININITIKIIHFIGWSRMGNSAGSGTQSLLRSSSIVSGTFCNRLSALCLQKQTYWQEITCMLMISVYIRFLFCNFKKSKIIFSFHCCSCESINKTSH